MNEKIKEQNSNNLTPSIDRSNIYRAIENFTMGRVRNYDVIKSLQKINSTNIATCYTNNKITIMFTGYDGRNYTMQTRSENGLMPKAIYDVISTGNNYKTTVVAEATSNSKEKAMSKAYSNVMYKPIQELFEQLFGYKPSVIEDGFARGGRIYGDKIGVKDIKPNIVNYEATQKYGGDWNVKYKAEISFTYDTGIWRKPRVGDTYEDPLKNIWQFQDDDFWYIISKNTDETSEKRDFVVPTTRPYLLSEFTTEFYD